MAEITELPPKGPLRFSHLPGRGRTLVVSFSGVGTDRLAPPPPEFPGIASDGGRNHVLFVADRERTWLNAPGMADDIAATVARTARMVGAARLVALGNSMGGTMALHLSHRIGFSAVVALAPQYSADPREVPEETRWRRFRDRIAHHRFRRIETLEPARIPTFILHGDTSDELIHALRFPRIRGLSHFILPGTGHGIAASLKRRGHLAELVRLGLAGRKRPFRLAVEGLGGVFRSRYDAPMAAAA